MQSGAWATPLVMVRTPASVLAGSGTSICWRLRETTITPPWERSITTIFNGAARESTIWTAEQLTGDEAEFLSALPLVAQMDWFTLVHGSLADPLVEYLLDGYSANATLALLQTPFCLVGHSHLPFICRENDGAPLFVDFTEGAVTRWGEERWIINPGSVGQPRDRDPRPSYGIVDGLGRYPGAAPGGVRHRVDPGQDALCRITGVLGRPAQLRMLAGRSAVRWVCVRFSREVVEGMIGGGLGRVC